MNLSSGWNTSTYMIFFKLKAELDGIPKWYSSYLDEILLIITLI